jgi:membrane fusion protein (multidrug efflux system)
VIKSWVLEIAPASGSQFALLPPDNATGNFTKVVQRVPVKIALDNSPLTPQLRPGLSAVVTAKTKR